jgi:hypothetical protein
MKSTAQLADPIHRIDGYCVVLNDNLILPRGRVRSRFDFESGVFFTINQAAVLAGIRMRTFLF